MNTFLDTTSAANYNSPSQRIRVMSEDWIKSQAYCPSCGFMLSKYPNNTPVADFFCSECKEDFELKTKKDSFGSRIVDGAYSMMIKRLTENNNPNFLFLNYSKNNLEILNFLVIPKHFFIPEIIEERRPLALNARRAGIITSITKPGIV